jgi:hypothetical protein
MGASQSEIDEIVANVRRKKKRRRSGALIFF